MNSCYVFVLVSMIVVYRLCQKPSLANVSEHDLILDGALNLKRLRVCNGCSWIQNLGFNVGVLLFQNLDATPRSRFYFWEWVD